MISWARRAARFHGELVSLADIDATDPRWWFVAGGAALDLPARRGYITSDAEPEADTFIGFSCDAPEDAAGDAVARAHAARAAIRALDGTLPDQPLAVTIRRTAAGAIEVPSALDVAAFAIGARCWCARLDEPTLASDLARVLAGGAPTLLRPLGELATPFVCVTLGEEPIETARHGHRRAWLTNGASSGPWLGLSRASGMSIASTCHMVIDGYGHALLSARVGVGVSVGVGDFRRSPTPTPTLTLTPSEPLPVAWRSLDHPLRATELAYATGRLLYTGGRRSPTIQIPVAPGDRARRVVPALASVHFEDGRPEPFARFADRARDAIAREASGTGLISRLMATARVAPAPLSWKRRAIAAQRPRWLAPLAAVLGGSACVSRIRVDGPMPPACAASSPAQPGGLVITSVDDGTRAALTLCGSHASDSLLSDLLRLLPSG